MRQQAAGTGSPLGRFALNILFDSRSRRKRTPFGSGILRSAPTYVFPASLADFDEGTKLLNRLDDERMRLARPNPKRHDSTRGLNPTGAKNYA